MKSNLFLTIVIALAFSLFCLELNAQRIVCDETCKLADAPPAQAAAAKAKWEQEKAEMENQIGYNLYPGLPAYIQEIIEEMSSTELLCPFQEFDPALNERPEQEIDYDWEEDYREM